MSKIRYKIRGISLLAISAFLGLVDFILVNAVGNERLFKLFILIIGYVAGVSLYYALKSLIFYRWGVESNESDN